MNNTEILWQLHREIEEIVNQHRAAHKRASAPLLERGDFSESPSEDVEEYTRCAILAYSAALNHVEFLIKAAK